VDDLKAMFGRAGWFAIITVLRRVQISIDTESRCVTVWKDRQDPVRVRFSDIERFVNEQY